MSTIPADGPQVGPWALLRELGRGGNATVWEAVSKDFPTPIALKVINTQKADREPYQRFVREIRFLEALEDKTGVLPVLASHLPDKPSKADRAWLAMPIATPLREALAQSQLETVAEALAAIARTLARLAGLKAAHRDIKPDNLYELAGAWLVGDFGLVAVPEASELTEADRPLGPTFYRPYEMIDNPTTADPYAADVYAFGKTLWVLATGQNYPPSGHQPATTRKFSIADLRPHVHAGLLDELVDRATRLDPNGRPSMGEMAADLERWLELPLTTPSFDLSAEGARLRRELAAELEAEDLLEQRKELAQAAVRRLNDLVKPLNEALKTVHPRAQIEIPADGYMRNVLRTYPTSGSPDIVFKHVRMSQISTGPEHFVFALRIGRGIELTGEGDLIVRAVIDVSHPGFSGTDYGWHEELQAPVGSIESAAQLQQLAAEMQEHLREAVSAFTDRIAANG